MRVRGRFADLLAAKAPSNLDRDEKIMDLENELRCVRSRLEKLEKRMRGICDAVREWKNAREDLNGGTAVSSKFSRFAVAEFALRHAIREGDNE